MRSKINFERLGIIIVILIVIINYIFKMDSLAIITTPIALIIVMLLCHTSIIRENKAEKFHLTPSPNGEQCKGNGLSPNTECMCDECEYFLECYPYWDAECMNSENKD